MDGLSEILTKYPAKRKEFLIPILQDVQHEYGFISEESVKEISFFLDMPSSQIYGVATFYNQFRFKKRGKFHIRVCYGSACYVFGATTILQEIQKILNINDGETSEDGMFSLEIQSCIGGCGHAPVIAINDKFYSRVTPDKLQSIINECKSLIVD